MTREGAHPSPSSGALAAPEDFPLLAHEAAGDGGLVYLNSAATYVYYTRAEFLALVG